MPIASFLVWLCQGATATHMWLLRQLVCVLAFAADRSEWLGTASPDVVDAPILEGPVRMRRVPRAIKEAVAKDASRADTARTGSMFLRLAKRLRRQEAKQTQSANDWVWLRVSRYWAACQNLTGAARRLVVSLCCDATRVAGEDLLSGALYMPSSSCGFWLPPQAGPGGSEQ